MVRLLFGNTYIEIIKERDDVESLELIRQIPYVHSNKILTKFKTSITNIDLVLSLFKGVDIHNQNDDFYNTAPPRIIGIVEKELQRRKVTASLLELGPTGDPGFLLPHQQLGRELALVNDRFAFFYDTRTGKTPMSLQIIYDDISQNPNHKWLVLCPLILIKNAWLEDAEKFFPGVPIVNLHDTTKARRLKKFQQKANIYIINIESFAAWQQEIEKLGIHGVFVDESSTMKSNSSKFSKAAVDFATKVKRWYLLSGTPAPNNESEYYKQIQSVDFYGIHQSFNKFKEHFFNNLSRNPQYVDLVLRNDKKDELYELVGKYSLYVDKEDVLETPGRDFYEYEVEMPKELKDKYEHMRKHLYLDLNGRVSITAPSEAAKLNKLNQITSGFVIDTDAVFHNKIDEHKIVDTFLLSDFRFKELLKLLDSFGDEQALIWCNYKKEFEIINELIGDQCGFVYGDIKADLKNRAIADFKAGKIKYLVANPASADKGLTLTNAHIAVYFSMNYSFELFKQSMERIYGSVTIQPKRCKYYIFISPGTIDRVIYNAVKTKQVSSAEVLEHLKGGT
ncbi:ATP-dependent RNA helicase DbpA [compost metagenome]